MSKANRLLLVTATGRERHLVQRLHNAQRRRGNEKLKVRRGRSRSCHVWLLVIPRQIIGFHDAQAISVVLICVPPVFLSQPVH